MAIRGRKPHSPVLRLISGSHLKDRPPPQPRECESAGPGGPPKKPKKLKGAAGKLWDSYIARCHWLSWPDAAKALVWCHLQAEYEKKPTEMIASRIAQLRALGSELGFDVASRDRMGVTVPTGISPQDKADAAKKPSNPTSKYF